jgi:thioredoxin-related protein
MKKVLFFSLILMTSALAFMAFRPKASVAVKSKSVAEQITWYSWEQAVELNKKVPKKIFVDVYTDWCGWCKVMDRETFSKEDVAAYMSQNFYCVKLNAEQREPINFAGQKFEYVQEGRNGVNSFAHSLLDGKMSYPTVVYLTEKFERIMISPGYKKAEQILPELKYTKEEAYKTQSFNDFLQR